jgi:hypothetical protein
VAVVPTARPVPAAVVPDVVEAGGVLAVAVEALVAVVAGALAGVEDPVD